jgi:hypothetical protein
MHGNWWFLPWHRGYPAESAQSPAGSMQPDGIVLQVAAAVSADADDINDEVRRLNGVGVFAWRSESSNPRCLSLARVCTPRRTETLQEVAIVPSRLAYRNELLRCLVTYQNEPLSSRSPTMELAQNHQLLDEQAIHHDEWLHFANVYGQKRDGLPAPKLPSLQFGKKYNVAAFQVGVAGNIPKSLCKTGYELFPVVLKERLTKDDISREFVEATLYQRNVAVGPLRLQSKAHQAKGGEESKGIPLKPGKLGEDLELPPIPPTVQPLTRSFLALAADRKGPDAAAFQKAVQEVSRTLILLIPDASDSVWEKVGKQEWQFSVRCPAADIRVWDRSFDFVDEAAETRSQRTKTQRQQVWAETFKKIDDPKPEEGTDVTLDDPVVTGVAAILTPVNIESQSQVAKLDFQKWPDKEGIHAETTKSISIAINGRPDGVAKLAYSQDGGGFTVQVPQGQIWKLELWATIPEALAGQFQLRFQEYFKQLREDAFKEPLLKEAINGFLPASSRSFFIEVATAEMPSDVDLLDSLCVRAIADADSSKAREPWSRDMIVIDRVRRQSTLQSKWRIEAALDPVRVCELAGVSLFQWLHRVSVFVQRWRWNGRPLRDAYEEKVEPVFSLEKFFAAAADGASDHDAAQLIPWDGKLFGDRAAADYLQQEALVDFADIARKEWYEGAACVFQQDITGDPGALYFRFGVQAHSRYEGLLRFPPKDSRRGGGDIQPDAWKRLVVPCRYEKELPPPRLKLILPLTDVRQITPKPQRTHAPSSVASVVGFASSPYGSGPLFTAARLLSEEPHPSEETPGLLVVLNEPWFEYGGLAEDLVVEIADAKDPSKALGVSEDAKKCEPQFCSRPELGPDPIVAGKAVLITPRFDLDHESYFFKPLECHGPIGHTFDLDTTAPEFVNTSYLVPAPELLPSSLRLGGTKRDLSRYFIKLRFQRRLKDIKKIGDTEVLGGSYGWRKADKADPGGKLVLIPKDKGGVIAGNKFYSLKK